MMIGSALLLVALALGLALWHARAATGTQRRFAAALIMAAGLLLALTTGLCSLAGTAFILLTAAANRKSGGGLTTLILLYWPMIGFALTAFGIWMFRRGREKAQAGSEPD
jgi:hypothetical protein